MFFRRRSNDREVEGPSAEDAHQGDHEASHEPVQDPAERERARVLQCWRRSEQRVLRTWHAWQAAAARDKPERYRAYQQALADEERAAASMASAIALAEGTDPGIAEPARH